MDLVELESSTPHPEALSLRKPKPQALTTKSLEPDTQSPEAQTLGLKPYTPGVSGLASVGGFQTEAGG